MNPNKISDRNTEIDPCCKKVCKDLDEEIKARKESITRIKPSETTTRFYPSIQDSVSILEDLRKILGEEEICKCPPVKKVPIISPIDSERKRYPITISTGLTRIARSGEPILPSPFANGCCIDVCRVLNDQIKSIDGLLDASVAQRAGIEIEALEIEAMKKEEMGRRFMEKEEREERALKIAEWEMSKDPRFISLSNQSYTLKQYREYMKKNNICRCEL